MRMRQRTTPLGALFRGFAAGLLGSAVQNLFFRATARITPSQPEGVFSPPERQQEEENTTVTVARRLVEDFMQRGPLLNRYKEKAGGLVHYTYGGLWGGAYGLVRETFPALAKPLGVIGFSSGVWMLSDNLLLPAFRLAAWPQRYPMRNHIYAWVAHLAYGAGVWLGYEVLRPRALAAGVALLWAGRRRLRIRRFSPKAARPFMGKALDGLARARHPLSRALAEIRA